MARVKTLFKGPGPQANGLSAAADGLWVSDQKDNRIYKVRYEDGSVITSFDTPARNLSGCGFGGGSVWGGSNIRPSAVVRHDPKTGWCTQYILLPNGESGGVHGIEWHDGESPYNLLRHHGYDPDMFAGDTGIVISRGMMIARLRRSIALQPVKRSK